MNRYIPYFSFISIILSCSSIVAMEKPSCLQQQLQAKAQAKGVDLIYYAMITDPLEFLPKLNYPVKYATSSIHTKLNLPSTIKDPVVTFNIVDDLHNPSAVKLRKVFLLKHTFNLNDGSTIAHVKRTGAELYPHNSSLKDKQFLIEIVCAKNPKLEGNSFAKQRYFAKQDFYKEPSTWIDEKDTQQQLIDAGIIKKTGTTSAISQMNNNPIQCKTFDIFGHGPNGIANDEQLRQSIIDEKIPKNRSIFKSLEKRRLTGSFK